MMRALGLALLIAAAPAFAQAPQQRSITVTGTGSVRVAPDRFSFTVGVATTNASVAAAFRENSEKTKRVIDALKAHGVPAAEIQTTELSISEPYENGQRLSGRYVVANSVTVTRSDPKDASELIQASVDAGANSLNGIKFSITDEAAVRDRALVAAYGEARRRAEKLAAAAGKTLGDAQLITTDDAMGVYSRGITEAITVTAAAAPVESGTETISATVTVTFDLR